MTSIRRMSGRALSGGRLYEGMVSGVGGEKSCLETGNRSLTMEVMGRAMMDMAKAFELSSRISRDGG
jgi:hypothetical protein